MNIRRNCLLLVSTLMLTACVSPPIEDKLSSEKLLAEPPPDWTLIYQLNNVTSRLSEFVPKQESASQWSTKLSFESFLELADIDPIQTLLTEVEQDKKRCKFVQHFNLYSGLENNYPSSVRLFFCGEVTDTQPRNTQARNREARNKESRNKEPRDKEPRDKESGEVKMIKVIQGNDYLYIITLVKKVNSFKPNQAEMKEKEIAGWSTYLRGISLCDSGHESHDCPLESEDALP